MTLTRVSALTGMLVAATVALSIEGGLVSAVCVPPTVEYSAGPVDRGAPVTVRGSRFGDNCYDTGAPPPGVGSLGNPLNGIVVSIVQNDEVVVVAKGSANAQYEFEVTVPVPAGLSPGEATILVSSRAAYMLDATDAPLLISEAPAPVDADGVATFGPPTTSPVPSSASMSVASANSQRGATGSRLAAFGTVALLIVGVITGTLVLRRRQQL